MSRKAHKAFTLSELLIALAILGVIATFTIPKVLQSQQDGRFKSIAKETAGTISNAYTVYKSRNTPDANTSAGAILANVNYVRIDTSSATLDSFPTDSVSTLTCTNTEPCYRLHNGAVIWYFANSLMALPQPMRLRFT